jgi:hypothetical protein
MKFMISLRLVQHAAVTQEGLDRDMVVKGVVEKLQLTYDQVEVVGVQELVTPPGSPCDQVVAKTGLPHETAANLLEEAS